MKRRPIRILRTLAASVLALTLIGLWARPQDPDPKKPVTEAQIAEWLRRAEQGLALAQNNLGFAYDNGEGVPINLADAVKSYRRAAEQGLALAQNKPDFIYGNGEGVPEDYVLAYAWVILAAAQGQEVASTMKDSLLAIMTPDQIARAQELSASLNDGIVTLLNGSDANLAKKFFSSGSDGGLP